MFQFRYIHIHLGSSISCTFFVAIPICVFPWFSFSIFHNWPEQDLHQSPLWNQKGIKQVAKYTIWLCELCEVQNISTGLDFLGSVENKKLVWRTQRKDSGLSPQNVLRPCAWPRTFCCEVFELLADQLECCLGASCFSFSADAQEAQGTDGLHHARIMFARIWWRGSQCCERSCTPFELSDRCVSNLYMHQLESSWRAVVHIHTDLRKNFKHMSTVHGLCYRFVWIFAKVLGVTWLEDGSEANSFANSPVCTYTSEHFFLIHSSETLSISATKGTARWNLCIIFICFLKWLDGKVCSDCRTAQREGQIQIDSLKFSGFFLCLSLLVVMLWGWLRCCSLFLSTLGF